jgi:mannose-1-phosphate guanylyltransferase/mannose-1-phosphate guanylyltransferase/mannose-6-phosphate isomerase
MPRTIYPVILSGGSGTRLWPLSRDLFPKQLLPLVSHESLLAATARRATGDDFARPIIVCNRDHRLLVERQMGEVGITPEAIIIEPIARNTAPAIAAAALLLQARDPDALMLVLPSDHIIRNTVEFALAVATAAQTAEAGYLVTFGITPTAPETGYGYIRAGAPIPDIDGAYSIERFVEKPNLDTAIGYLAEGDWSWNSGMFVFPVAFMLEELARFEPAMTEATRQAVSEAEHDGAVVTLDRAAFGEAPSKSIDYALMEPTEKSAVVPVDLGWSDVGSWSALWEIADKDESQNVLIGDVMVEKTAGSYLRSHGPLIATLGVDDMIVVATGDVVMVAAKHRAQDVKTFVNRLRGANRTEGISHRLIHHPWGSHEILASDRDCEVKRVTLMPGAKLTPEINPGHAVSLSVVAGTAELTLDGEERALAAPGSVHVRAGGALSIENAGADLLKMIVVQSAAAGQDGGGA